MGTNKGNSTRSFAKEELEDTTSNQVDSELASGYAANSDVSLEIAEAFAALDQDD